MTKKQGYPFTNTSTYVTYIWGKAYKIAQDGDILTARERGVKMGEVRMFFAFSNDEDTCMYFAERLFKSILHPFRAPIIWWRQVK